MENYKISSDSGQGNDEWQTVWRVAMISVLTPDKVKLTVCMGENNFSSDTKTIKMMAVSMENCNYITSNTGQDKTDNGNK